MRNQIVGRCSICGGRVLQYKVLHIVGPFPPAVCEKCGAEESVRGPIIPMEKPRNLDSNYLANSVRNQ